MFSVIRLSELDLADNKLGLITISLSYLTLFVKNRACCILSRASDRNYVWGGEGYVRDVLSKNFFGPAFLPRNVCHQ